MAAIGGDGQRALEALLDGSYELALLDWMLPGCDGLTIVQTLRYPGNSQRRTFPIRGLSRGLYYLRTVENGRTQGTLRLIVE